MVQFHILSSKLPLRLKVSYDRKGMWTGFLAISIVADNRNDQFAIAWVFHDRHRSYSVFLTLRVDELFLFQGRSNVLVGLCHGGRPHTFSQRVKDPCVALITFKRIRNTKTHLILGMSQSLFPCNKFRTSITLRKLWLTLSTVFETDPSQWLLCSYQKRHNTAARVAIRWNFSALRPSTRWQLLQSWTSHHVFPLFLEVNSKIFSSTSGKVSPQRQRPHPASSNVAAVVVAAVVLVYTFSRLCSWGFPVFNFRASVNDKNTTKLHRRWRRASNRRPHGMSTGDMVHGRVVKYWRKMWHHWLALFVEVKHWCF